MFSLKHLLAALVSLLGTFSVDAFNGHQATDGPITLVIGDIPTVTNLNVPQTFTVTVTNTSVDAIAVRLQMGGLADETRAVGETERRLAIPARSNASTTFQFTMHEGSLSALYPVHLWARFERGGSTRVAHAVRIFETAFKASGSRGGAPTELPLVTVPSAGALPLATLKDWQVGWQWSGKPVERLPVRWQGSEDRSSANFLKAPLARGGETRQALQMHPPYRGGVGTVFAEWGCLLDSTSPNLLGCWTNNPGVRVGFDLHGLLRQSVKQLAA